jgi:putative ABC transport system ATP-binding protein
MLLSIEHAAKVRRVGPHQTPTLLDVSLSIDAGDFVGVWGQRRSGKSTLLRIAGGLEAPDSGRVTYDGQDLARLSVAQRTQLRLASIGLVTGDGPQCSDFTVLDYVKFPLLGRFPMKVARERAMKALRRVGIEDYRDATWDELSDSERSLTSLAHGLVREPRLLLVDDPVVGLDPDQQCDVVDILRSAAADDRVAVLMTSSVLSAIAPAHEAYVLGGGRLAPVTDPAAPSKVIDFPSGGQTA